MQGTGGSKSLPSTPREHEAKDTVQIWSTGNREATDRQRRPVGVRVKLFDDDTKDIDIDPKPQKSVHWGTDGRPSDEGIRLGDSPTQYWNVENDIIKSTSNDRGNMELMNNEYFLRDDFDARIAATVASQGSNGQAVLMSGGHNLPQTGSHSLSTSDQQVSQMRSVSSVANTEGLPSQTVIQDRLLRDGHFTSSPKLDRSKTARRDNTEDISLVSSISAPLELRPKAYDDSVLSEQTTFVDDNNGEDVTNGIENQRLHQSDGAAQLISLRQSQSTSVANPSSGSLLPVSGAQTRAPGMELRHLMQPGRDDKENFKPLLQEKGTDHSGRFHPLLDDTMVSTASKERSSVPVSSTRIAIMTSTQPATFPDSHSDGKWVDNALSSQIHQKPLHTTGDSSNTAIQNLEQVRSHLHNMINMTKEALPGKAAFDQTDEGGHELLDGLIDVKQDESFSSAGSFPVLGGKSLSDIESVLGLSSGGMQLTTNYQTGSTNSSVLLSEIQLNKEQLQRERFRRKHCEKQITELQSKMLELQQQLAVAVSTDRKKETMIEHLDKALAKVVDGWKKKDAEKIEVIKKLEKDNSELNGKCALQAEELRNMTCEIDDLKERLSLEMNRANQAEKHAHLVINQQSKEREESKNLLEQESIRLGEMEMDRNGIQAAKETLLANFNDLQQTYENDKENWEEKERDYLQKIDEITDNHLKCMDQERIKLEKQEELLTDTQQVLAAAQTEVHSLKMQLDNATREKESLRVEIGLLEARLENSKRKLESDLRSDFERQMTERLEEAHNRQMSSEEELRERHRRQMFELNQRHSSEMEEQLQQYQEDIRRKEEKITQQAVSFEERFTEMKIEMDTMKAYVRKLESQRLEMTNKLQSMMQSHCNEALRLLQIGSSNSSSVTMPVNVNGVEQNQEGTIYTTSLSGGHTTTVTNTTSNHGGVTESLIMPQTSTVKGNVPSESLARAEQKVQHQVAADFESASLYREELGNKLKTPQVNNSVHPDNYANLEHSSRMQPFQSTNTVQLYQNEDANRQRHQQLPTRSMQTSFGNGIQQFQSASTVPTLQQIDDERQYQNRFRILHGGNIEKYSDQDDFSRLSYDNAMDVTSGEQPTGNDEALFSRGQMNHESLDLQLCPGSLQDGDYDSNGYQSARSQNSSNNSDSKAVTEKVLVHEERQTELQHNIKKLLQKSPNSPERQQEVPTNTPADPVHSMQDNGYLQPSVSPDTNTDKSVTIFSPTRAPDSPPIPAFHKSLVRAAPLSNTEMRDPGDGRGILSPQQVGEISRLLGLYRPGPEGSSNITSAGTTPPMSDLLTYLKDLKPESRVQVVSDQRVSQEAPTRDVTSLTKPAKRNLSSTYNAAARKQLPNEITTKGSPTSSKQDTGNQTTKIVSNKPLQTQLKHSAPRGNIGNSKNSSALPSTKKSDKRSVPNKAKQGNIWK